MPEKPEEKKKKEEAAAAAKAAKEKKAAEEAKAKEEEAKKALAEFPEWATATVEEGAPGRGMIPVNFRSFKAAYDFCTMMTKTGFLPEAVKHPGQAMAIAIYGQELGIPLMTSFRTIHVVNGKPGLAAEMMLAKFIQRGGTVKWGATTDEICEGLFISKGTPDGFSASFSIKQANKAGLTSKAVWKNYPQDMLRARCISRGVRGSDPAACAGLHTPEEMGGDMTPEGKIIDADVVAPVPKDVDLSASMKAKKIEEEKAAELSAAEEDSRHQEGEASPEEEPTKRQQENEDAATAPAKPAADDPEGLFS